MRKCLPYLLFILAFYTSKAQSDSKSILGNIDSIDSKILQEKRKVWVYVPNSASGGTYARPRYPVVYVLDGNKYFNFVVEMIQQLGSFKGTMPLPEMIVVGIPNTDRTRDLTPTHTYVDLFSNDSNEVRTSGGGEKFISFIEKELMPYIEATYPTLPYRTLLGHSYGGLAVMNTMVHHKDLFNAYIAIDPSMWYDKRNLLARASSILMQRDYKGKTLYLGIANTMKAGMDTSKVKQDTSLATEHIRAILALNTLLQKSKGNGLTYDYKYYSSDSHNSVPLIATYDAFRFIFGCYDFRQAKLDYANFSMETVKKAEDHFRKVSLHLGFDYPIPEMLTYNLANTAISKNRIAEAEYLLKMNVNNYPTSLLAYNTLGDFYAGQGKKEKAIENYQKALNIKESPEMRKKLKTLSK
jgi:uncharacterized protein